MLGLDTLITFIAASALLTLAPGPDNIFVLLQSAMHGRRAGVIVTLGLCTGLIAHTLAVSLGIAVIFQVSALAFTLLKVAGAIYLLYLAWQSIRAAASHISDENQPVLGSWSLYRRGVLMSSSNPKLAIFFMAFLPQFADPAAGSLSLQLAQLGLVFILVAFCVMGMIALLAAGLSGWLRESPRGQVLINRLAGVVFIGLAVKLVTAEQHS
ncbi:LysE family translocator [Neptuniibacter halophilus]|uniref:LysE family translocator n=1 Tax=Neptuniibacter halophilus TaxID=651666 RepID=UPI002572E68C|nr:LysE family translocator [Neptuniibacter halophilus]